MCVFLDTTEIIFSVIRFGNWILIDSTALTLILTKDNSVICSPNSVAMLFQAAAICALFFWIQIDCQYRYVLTEPVECVSCAVQIGNSEHLFRDSAVNRLLGWVNQVDESLGMFCTGHVLIGDLMLRTRSNRKVAVFNHFISGYCHFFLGPEFRINGFEYHANVFG